MIHRRIIEVRHEYYSTIVYEDNKNRYRFSVTAPTRNKLVDLLKEKAMELYNAGYKVFKLDSILELEYTPVYKKRASATNTNSTGLKNHKLV